MNAKSVCFFLGILLMVSSCTIKEELTLNEDGSGTFSYGFDVSALMKMGKPSDSIKVPKVIDSVFSFRFGWIDRLDVVEGCHRRSTRFVSSRV